MIYSCAAHGCSERIHRTMFMCRPHWRMAPSKVRAAVTTAWRDRLTAVNRFRQEGECALAALEHARAHHRACQARAVLVVAQKEDHPPEVLAVLEGVLRRTVLALEATLPPAAPGPDLDAEGAPE